MKDCNIENSSLEENNGLVLPLGSLTKEEVDKLERVKNLTLTGNPDIKCLSDLKKKIEESVFRKVKRKVMGIILEETSKRLKDNLKPYLLNDDLNINGDFNLKYIETLYSSNNHVSSLIDTWVRLSAIITLLNTKACKGKNSKRFFYRSGISILGVSSISQEMIMKLSNDYSLLINLFLDQIILIASEDYKTFLAGYALNTEKLGLSKEETIQKKLEDVLKDPVDEYYISKHLHSCVVCQEAYNKHKDDPEKMKLLTVAFKKYAEEQLKVTVSRLLLEVYERFQQDRESLDIFRDPKYFFLRRNYIELAGYEEFVTDDNISFFLKLLENFKNKSPLIKIIIFIRGL